MVSTKLLCASRSVESAGLSTYLLYCRFNKLKAAVTIQIIDQTGSIFDKLTSVVTAFLLYVIHKLKIINYVKLSISQIC